MKKALLLGAGFSYDLGMPLVTELTEVFLGIFEEKSALNFAKKISTHNPYGNDRPINEEAVTEGIKLILEYKRNKGGNYEYLLSQLQNLRGRNQSDRDSYHYLTAHFYGLIHKILTYYQIESYSILYPKNYPFYSKLSNLLSDEGETWIFTLNHDMYIECLALDLKIPISYGDSTNITSFFTNSWNEIKLTSSIKDQLLNANFIKGKSGINLVKIHGGLSEFLHKDSTVLLNQSLSKNNSSDLMNEFGLMQDLEYNSNPRGIGKDIFSLDHNKKIDVVTRSMLTGSNKYGVASKRKKVKKKFGYSKTS